MEAYLLTVEDPDAEGFVPTATPQTMSTQSGSGEFIGINARMSHFLGALQSRLGKPVIDDTGLSGGFDIELRWKQENPGGPDDPSKLIEAVREQLGLKLKAGRYPVEVLVVEERNGRSVESD